MAIGLPPKSTQIGVNPDLYYLVFGESLLNDGVAVVLYDMMNIFVGMENAGEVVTIDQVLAKGYDHHHQLVDRIYFLQILLGILSFFTVVGGGLFVGILFGIATALLTRYSLINFSA